MGNPAEETYRNRDVGDFGSKECKKPGHFYHTLCNKLLPPLRQGGLVVVTAKIDAARLWSGRFEIHDLAAFPEMGVPTPSSDIHTSMK